MGTNTVIWIEHMLFFFPSRCPHIFQQQCNFRKAYRKPESRKADEDPSRSRTQPSEATAPHRLNTTPQMEHPVPPHSPRPFGRLVRPLVFTMGVSWRSPQGLVGWCHTGDNVMSVHRLRLRLGSHLAVWILEVSSPELLWRSASWLAGKTATSKTRRYPQTGEDSERLWVIFLTSLFKWPILWFLCRTSAFGLQCFCFFRLFQINQWWLSLSEGQRTVTGETHVQSHV